MYPPLIGITTGYHEHGEPTAELAKRYVDAVVTAGGLPVVLAPVQQDSLIERYASVLDGLIVSGGRDIPPDLYGEPPHPKTDALPEDRPRFEMALVRRFQELNKPVLGICYGCQLLNVAFGGKLIQDIPSEFEHPRPHRRTSSTEPHACHVVHLSRASRLENILGKRVVEIVSSHHQAVREPAPGFRVTATAPDEVIEAIELEDARFVIGVQWHPELDPEAEATQRLMQAFIRAASEPT